MNRFFRNFGIGAWKLVFALLLSSAVAISCRENTPETTTEVTAEDHAIEKAKLIYKKIESNITAKFGKRYHLSPEWEKAELKEQSEGGTALYVPVGSDRIFGRKLLLVLSDKNWGVLPSQLLEYRPSADYVKAHGSKISIEDYEGKINFYDLDANFIVSASYKGGKFGSYLTPFTKLTSKNARTSNDDPAWENDLNTVKVIGQKQYTPPTFIFVPTTVYSYSGGIYNSYYYGAAATYSTSGGAGIDCASFDFKKTSGNWQEAAITGFHFTVINTTNLNVFTFYVPVKVVIGVPVQRANGVIYSTGDAATIAAQILEDTADELFDRYKNVSPFPSETRIGQEFWEVAKQMAQPYGATVDRTGSGSPSIVTKSAQWQTWGNGDC